MAGLAFTAQCPVCGRRLIIRISYLGKRVICRHCGGQFVAQEKAADRSGGLLEDGPAESAHSGLVKKSGPASNGRSGHALGQQGLPQDLPAADPLPAQNLSASKEGELHSRLNRP